jgi:hypothetical protein
MRMYQRKRITKSLLLSLVLLLALSFTAVVQAGGDGQPAPTGPVPPGPDRPPMGKPPMDKPPMDKYPGAMFPAIPELENCIGVFTWYDGNLNGMLDANEDPMDGAKVLLMTELPPPSMEPPIGPDGKEIGMPKMPMGPGYGPPMQMDKQPVGPPHDGPPPKDGPMPPGGPMPPKGMPKNEGFAKFQVKDGRVTRDGGVAVFCDLEPGNYILQGDAVDGITFGDNRRFTMLEEGGYAVVGFGFTYLNGGPELSNGNGM